MQDFISEKVGDRHFCGWDQIEWFLFDFKKVIFKFRQLSGAEQGVAVYEVGDAYLFKTSAAVEVEHIVDEGALESGSIVFEYAKAAFCQFDAALEVDPVGRNLQIPVLFWGEVEFSGFEYFFQFDIVLFVFSFRYIVIRNVGNIEGNFIHLLFEVSDDILFDGDFLLVLGKFFF